MAKKPRERGANIPHVLHVVDADEYARFGRMFRQLGIALSDEAIRVSLLTDDAHAAAKLDGTPIDDVFFPNLGGWGAWRLRGFLRKQFVEPPDAVHVWGATCLHTLSEWTVALAIPLIIHITSHTDIEALQHRGIRSNERLFAGCREFEEQLADRWPTVADGFETLVPAVLTHEVPETPRPRDRTLGVLWSGYYDAHNELSVLVDAVAKLREKDLDLQVALIGYGPSATRAWELIRGAKVADCFTLLDYAGLWDHALPGADVMVVPTTQQHLSLAPLLAMALQKVVITSRDQIAEWFIEDETSLQFTPGSAVELAYHLSRTAAGHPNVLALTRSAAGYVRAHHSIPALATRLADVYHRLHAARDPEATHKTGAPMDDDEGGSA